HEITALFGKFADDAREFRGRDAFERVLFRGLLRYSRGRDGENPRQEQCQTRDSQPRAPGGEEGEREMPFPQYARNVKIQFHITSPIRYDIDHVVSVRPS